MNAYQKKLLFQDIGRDHAYKIAHHQKPDHYARHGLVGTEDLERIRSRSDYYSRLVPQVPRRYRRIMEGDEVQIGDHRWRRGPSF